MKKSTVALAILATPTLALAQADAQAAIVSAGSTVAGYAGAAGAAGVAVMIVIWGIVVASRALKAPKA
jgi:hypothetical protein